MKFTQTKLKGAYIIDLEKKQDERGHFSRVFCQNEFAKIGLETKIAQANISHTLSKGTLRGMHYQKSPHEETKVVSCIKGALYDVIIDLRTDSETYKQWIGVELTEKNGSMLYVPRGFAHGFLTLADDTEALYFISEFYAQKAEAGVRYNDSTFSITWPEEVLSLSEKDASWPDYKEQV